MNDRERIERGQKDLNNIRLLAARIIENFDTVQIFCTRDEGGGTSEFAVGTGNYYARYGQVRLWADAQRPDYDDVSSYFRPADGPDDEDDA